MIKANYFVDAEFKDTLHKAVDNLKDGNWATLIEETPQGIMTAPDEIVFVSRHLFGNELVLNTIESLETTMDYGATTGHAPGSWHSEGLTHHMEHATIHVQQYNINPNPIDLEHALCRLAMAYFSSKKGIYTVVVSDD